MGCTHPIKPVIPAIKKSLVKQRVLGWSLGIFKKRTKHVVIASEVKQPSTEF
jgi:hypothetical protein